MYGIDYSFLWDSLSVQIGMILFIHFKMGIAELL